MIDKLSYEDVLLISKELKQESDIIKNLASKRNLKEIEEFASVVDGYSKFLENTVGINKDADEALKELRDQINK